MKIFKRYNDKLNGKIKYEILGIKFTFSDKNFKYRQLSSELAALRNVLRHSIDLSNLLPATGKEREHQLECLEIFKRVANVCKNNNLQYFISFGTCLGAVRNKGFIPWDDDIDISMLRDEYLKIIPLLQEEFKGSKYIVREILHHNFQLRICDKDKPVIGIDIFPMDRYCKSELTKEETYRLNKKIHETIADLKDVKFGSDTEKVRKYISKFTQKLLNNKPEAENKPILFYGIDYPHNHEHLVFEYSTIFPLKEIEFEGVTVSVPNDTDRYLRLLYGNYMTLPKKHLYE